VKWPNSLTVIRHGQSAYNILKEAKVTDPEYAEFKKAYNRVERDPERARELALKLVEGGRFSLGVGDHSTSLTEEGRLQARKTGSKLSGLIELPDIIFVSPYERTLHTLEHITEGWPELSEVRIVEDERLREQEHGLATLYGDWRIFQALHSEQAQLRAQEGSYWYRYPQGENVPDVRERTRSWQGMLIREFSGKDVLAITHHLSILALRANQERFGAAEFQRLDDDEKPLNCGVTIYKGNPEIGQDGRLELELYNQKLYED
jgi:probable phosphoglycerate mutase